MHCCTDSTKKTVRAITYVCIERIFDSRLLLYNKLSLKKLLKGIFDCFVYFRPIKSYFSYENLGVFQFKGAKIGFLIFD